jgi:hypothetical protein
MAYGVVQQHKLVRVVIQCHYLILTFQKGRGISCSGARRKVGTRRIYYRLLIWSTRLATIPVPLIESESDAARKSNPSKNRMVKVTNILNNDPTE